MRSKFLPSLILTGISLLATVLLLELGLHLLNFPPQSESHQKLFVEHDPRRGWRNIPDNQGTIETDEYQVTLSYNARGLRGPLYPYEKPPDTYRILVLGDSFVEGYTVPLEQRFTEILARNLNAYDPPSRVEVIAMGTAGYSTDQEYLWFMDEGKRYQPDLVILMFHYNDVWYNAQPRYTRGSKPMFVLQNGDLVLTHVPVPPPEPEDHQEARAQAGIDFGTINDWVRDHSKLYWILARAMQNNPRLYALAVRAGLAIIPPEMVFDAQSQVIVPGEFTVYHKPYTPEVEQAWEITTAIIAHLKAETEALGAQFLAFNVPLRGTIYTEEWQTRQTVDFVGEGWDVNAVSEQFLTICEQLDLHCIEPTDQFRTRAEELNKQGKRLYYSYDWHWNASGNQFAAELLKAYIRDQIWSP